MSHDNEDMQMVHVLSMILYL